MSVAAQQARLGLESDVILKIRSRRHGHPVKADRGKVGIVGRSPMPKLGDRKACILGRCDGTMEWKTVRVRDVEFHNPAGDSPRPEPIPDYEAWVCDACEFEHREIDVD
jgi:hypothetical protein